MEAWLISFGIRGGALPHTLAFLKPRKRETEGGGRGQRRSRRATDGARSGSRSQWRLCGPNFPADTPTRVCLLTVLGGLACLLAGEGGIEGGAVFASKGAVRLRGVTLLCPADYPFKSCPPRMGGIC